jgi:hypothetical protein
VSFANWLSLSWDHLLPKGHSQRDNADFILNSEGSLSFYGRPRRTATCIRTSAIKRDRRRQIERSRRGTTKKTTLSKNSLANRRAVNIFSVLVIDQMLIDVW